MQAHRKRQALAATVISSLVLLGTAGLGTGAQAAGSLHKCGNRSFTIEIAQGTVPQTFHKFPITVKDIAVSGISCKGAFKFLNKLYTNHTPSITPEHFKCVGGHFKAPIGSVPEVCTRKGVKIQYAGQGG
jgi:hypothetical protein